jgi:PKD repeat protein
MNTVRYSSCGDVRLDADTFRVRHSTGGHLWRNLFLSLVVVSSLYALPAALADVVIDNGNPGTSYTGTWQVSSGTGYYGTNSLWSRDGATYIWAFNSQPSGTYEVLMWWTTYSSRTNNVPVDIIHSAGTNRVYINQQINGGMWNSLGEFFFAGSGSVTLNAPNPSPTSYCADAVWFRLVSENLQPTAFIDSITPSPASPGELVQFTGHGTDDDGYVTGYEWRSNIDGVISNSASFSKSNLSEGAHNISFRVQDNQGIWSAAVTAVLIIGEVPTEVIIDNSTANTTSTGTWQVSGASGYYGANSLWSRDGATYTWRFNPPQTGLYEVSMWWTLWSSRSTSIPVTIQNSGATARVNINQQQNGSQWNSLGQYSFEAGMTYNVTITSQPGPSSTNADAVRFTRVVVNLPPTAYIDSILPNPGKPGQIVQFTGHGTDSDGSITGYEWQSDIDGILSDANSFTVSDLSEGTHTISFRVQDDEGDWSVPATNTLFVGNLLPTATIDSILPNPAKPGQIVQFTGHGTDSDGSVAGYEWQSDIDGVLSNADSFSDSGLSEGTHTISFRVQDDEGDWSVPAIDTLIIGNAAPTATIDSIFPNPAKPGELVQFTGHGTDSDGSVTGYEWQSDVDGILSDANSFSASDLSEGTHTISFRVQDDIGDWSIPATDTLVIVNMPPTATIDSILPNPAMPGELVHFTGHGTDSDGSVVGYEWQSDIDGILSDANSFSISDLSEGTHTISFRVQDDTGDWSVAVTNTLFVGNIAPTAYIDSITPNPATLGQSVTFTGHGADSDGTITGYNWTSSIDGFLSDEASFSTASLSLGQHTITFTVMDNGGDTSAPVTRTLTIRETPSNVEHIFACYVYGPGYGQGQFRNMLRDIGAYQQGENWIYETPQKTFIIHFPDTIEELADAFETEGAHILVNGHSNYGLGTFFATDQEVTSQCVENLHYIDDDRMLNFSSPWVSINLNYLRNTQRYPQFWTNFKDGTSAIMPYDFDDPQGDPPYNYYPTYQVPGDPTHYKVETVRNSAVTRFFDAGYGGASAVPWYSADGAKPDPNNPEHHKHFITNSSPWSPSFESVGNWIQSYLIYNVDTAPYFKENYIYSNAGHGENTAEWMFSVPYGGDYTIWAWWPASSSRSSGAPYTVNHAFGSTTVPMNQTTNGKRWNVVGTYSFDANNDYSVVLSNNVASGNVAADALKITHADNPPEIIQADFYANPRVGPTSTQFVFYNQSTGDYTARTWNFGDGQTNDSRDFADHIYTRAGTYTVTLTVSGPLGSSTRTKTSYIIVGNGVTEPIKAEFSARNYQGIIPLSVRFSNGSSSNAVSWLWDFGDGNTSTVQRPTYVYTTPGNFTVSLTVTDAHGNSHTEAKQNFVRTYIFEKIIDNVDYPKNHYGSKVIVFRKDLEVNPEEFRYARLFYASCNSGNYYIDTFHHGVMFYTLAGDYMSTDLAFSLYLRPYLEGRSDQYIWQILQAMEPVWDYYDFTRPPPTQTLTTTIGTAKIAGNIASMKAATVKTFVTKEQRKRLKELKGLPLEEAFERLKGVEFMTNDVLMKKAVSVAFKHRKAEAISMATNYVRLPVESVVDGQRVNRLADFFVAKKILQVFASKAKGTLLELYKTDDTVVKGNIIQVAGGMAGNAAMRKLLIAALDDKTICEDRNPETEGEYLRICDMAYNQLVLCRKLKNVLRTIGNMQSIEVRDYHIDLLKNRF